VIWVSHLNGVCYDVLLIPFVAAAAAGGGRVQVTLSKILGWYYTDFGSDKAARLRFLLPYLPADKRSALESLLAADPSAGGIRVEYAPYDWTINAAVE
jgi:hypothetical protein